MVLDRRKKARLTQILDKRIIERQLLCWLHMQCCRVYATFPNKQIPAGTTVQPGKGIDSKRPSASGATLFPVLRPYEDAVFMTVPNQLQPHSISLEYLRHALYSQAEKSGSRRYAGLQRYLAQDGRYTLSTTINSFIF